MIQNNAPALAPLIFLFAGIIIPLAALKLRSFAYPIALVATLTSTIVSISNVFFVLDNGPVRYFFGGWPPPIGIEYVLDPLSAFLTAVINGITFIVLIHAGKIVEKEIPAHKRVPYYALVMLFLCGCNGIILTGDFFNLYVFLEISSLALYGMVAVGDKKASFSAFRYLIMGTVGGGFYLLGVGFLYVFTGSLNMADIKGILPVLGPQPVVIVALSLMVLGLGIKMALFPLHGWLPDAYTYAPSASSSIMAPVGIKVGAYGILRILLFVFGVKFVTQLFPIAQIITWLSAAGIIYGSIMAISQDELKRMLAYSSISQIGYIGLGIGLSNPYGIIGAVLHILNHGLMKACLFLVAGNFRMKLGHTNIREFNASLRKTMPWTTASFVAGALAMVGIPPTVGFFSKWYLALGTIENRSWILLAVILLSSLLNAVYFFRIIE
ncbi:MAG: monovalent cation/H+ antiporter subunit D family protein, partial [Candidatus Aminicenantes bacterium]|nr:monovalent cation/H+ antiporter subunit D family protein [Candidatus Aminicenantes bacterium]